VRTLAFVDGGLVRLQTRNLLDCTKQYPEIDALGGALTGAYHAIIDGEIVALDEKGVPSFQRLQPRMHQRDEAAVKRLRKSTPVVYEAFDLLYQDGEDLRSLPLRERRKRLEAVLTPMGPIRLSAGFAGSGKALFDAVQEQGLEGIVAKRLDAPYVSGRSAAWIKVKARRSLECVIGGWTAGQGGRQGTLGALVVGVYREGRLEPVGHVGTGFDDRTLRDLLATLREHESPAMPFATPPRLNQPAKWCLPELVCEVQYAELTADGTLRHPTYRGLRADIDPRDCTGEERRASTKEALRSAERAVSAGPAAAAPAKQTRVPAVLEIDGHQIKLTNLEKVLFPEDGYTKADLIRYYTEVSPYLVPFLTDRPLTLKPFPDGIAGPSFYQKDKPGFTPRWIASWTDTSADRAGRHRLHPGERHRDCDLDGQLHRDRDPPLAVPGRRSGPSRLRDDRSRPVHRCDLGRREGGRARRAGPPRGPWLGRVPEDDRLARDPRPCADRAPLHVRGITRIRRGHREGCPRAPSRPGHAHLREKDPARDLR